MEFTEDEEDERITHTVPWFSSPPIADRDSHVKKRILLPGPTGGKALALVNGGAAGCGGPWQVSDPVSMATRGARWRLSGTKKDLVTRSDARSP